MVWLLKVNTSMAAFESLASYISKQSVVKLTPVHDRLADGVQIAVLPDSDAAVPWVTVAPPAV